MSLPQIDIVIVGGGLSGLTLALQLKRQQVAGTIWVFERETLPYPEATHKVGESTVEVAAHYFSETLGLAQHLQSAQLRKLGIRMFFSSDDNSRIETRLEMGSNRHFYVPTYQIDRGRFENTLVEAVTELGVKVLSDCKVERVEIAQSTGAHTVHFVRNGSSEKVEARWVIDASGRAALMKRALGLKEQSEHRANAVWFRMRGRIDIDDWGSEPAWRDGHEGQYSRWYSTNHLTGEGYWVWLIPLASNYTSIGIVSDPAIHALSNFRCFDDALAWLQKFEPQLAEEIGQRYADKADYCAIKHYAHKCSRVISSDRWAIVGDAGVFIDPLYSPGSDFIAIQNTLVSDVIKRDFAGERFVGRAELYNELYLQLSENVLKTFHQQYTVFGNPRIMPLKVVWDYTVYWGFLAFIVNHGRLCDIGALKTIEEALQRVYSQNEAMQKLFRERHLVDNAPVEPGFFDIAEITELLELNRLLTIPCTDSEFLRQLAINMDRIEAAYHLLSTILKQHCGSWASANDLVNLLTAPQLARAMGSV